MQLKLNLSKILYFIGFICVFLPEFCIFFIPSSGANIYTGFVFWSLIALLCFLYKPIKTIKVLKIVSNTKIGKTYLIFITYIILLMLFHIIQGHYTASFSYYIVRLKNDVILSVLIYFLPMMSIVLNIKLKSLIKLFYIIVYSMFIIGITQFISYLLNLDFVINILDFFTNMREYTHYYLLDNPKNDLRVYAFFGEPAAFAKFIYITMPIIFCFIKSSCKLFKNNAINLLFKKTFMPLIFINLILTKSPIYFIFCTIEFLILNIYYYRNFIKKYFTFLFVSLITVTFTTIKLYFTFYNIITKSYLMRIVNTVQNMDSLQSIVYADFSLGTRIINYIIQIKAFSENVITGVGFCNIEAYLHFRFNKYDVPYTPENIFNYYNSPKLFAVGQNLTYTYLAELGIIGFIIFVIFIYRNYVSLAKLKTFFPQNINVFIQGLMQTIIAISALSFYNLERYNTVLWLILGFIPLIVYKYLIGDEINEEKYLLHC